MTVPPTPDSPPMLPPLMPDVAASQAYSIAAQSAAPIVLKEGATFLVADRGGDIAARGYGLGLYAHDTRYLSRCVLRVGGARLVATKRTQPTAAVASTRTRLSSSGRGWAGLVAHRTTIIDHGLHLHLALHNRSDRPRRVPLTLTLAADFRDMFEVRGIVNGRRGTLSPPQHGERDVRFRYEARDGVPLWTDVCASIPPTRVTQIATGRDCQTPGVRWHFSLLVPAGGRAEIAFVAVPGGVGPVPESPAAPVPLLRRARARVHAWEEETTTIVTDHDGLNRVLRRSAQDLRALLTPLGGGELPAAGIPWFVAPFGRDACITALFALPFAPRLAVGTLRALAATQGREVNPRRDEEPGKIVHEIREGELARLGLVPHAAYYGSVDSTPLFVMLFAAAMRWLDDDALFTDLLPAVRHALAWCDTYGDPDGDGYLEWTRRAPRGILNQGWKDSNDSLSHPDGTNVKRPVALVEPQAYVYAAKTWLAGVLEARGVEREWAGALRAQAAALAARIERDYWLPGEGTYAYALDADKRQVRTVVSNAGHLLLAGVPGRERAATLSARLLAPDMRSGWGIRTLLARMTRYNPNSYHNGSIWPHDNALIALGMRAAGQAEAAAVVASEVLQAAIVQPLSRLPELYGGYPRGTATAPAPYPVSCAPQAWAAAAPYALLTALLGLQVDGRTGTVTTDPYLPEWIGRVSLRGMRFGRSRQSLVVNRQ